MLILIDLYTWITYIRRDQSAMWDESTMINNENFQLDIIECIMHNVPSKYKSKRIVHRASKICVSSFLPVEYKVWQATLPK